MKDIKKELSTCKATIIVPARLDSKRIKQKLLYKVKGKPIILWTASNLKKEGKDFPLYFAVDSNQLEDCLMEEGYNVIRTSSKHKSGTDRIGEANNIIRSKYVINVQADEPFTKASDLYKLNQSLISGQHQMVTLASCFRDQDDTKDPNSVKVVLDKNSDAIYFSRFSIPYSRDELNTGFNTLRHIGMYGYSARFLNDFKNLEISRLEDIEKLEQLRVLYNGYKIHVIISSNSINRLSIDTIDDLK